MALGTRTSLRRHRWLGPSPRSCLYLVTWRISATASELSWLGIRWSLLIVMARLW